VFFFREEKRRNLLTGTVDGEARCLVWKADGVFKMALL